MKVIWIVSVHDGTHCLANHGLFSLRSAFDALAFWRIVAFNECGDEDDYTFTLKRIYDDETTEKVL